MRCYSDVSILLLTLFIKWAKLNYVQLIYKTTELTLLMLLEHYYRDIPLKNIHSLTSDFRKNAGSVHLFKHHEQRFVVNAEINKQPVLLMFKMNVLYLSFPCGDTRLGIYCLE